MAANKHDEKSTSKKPPGGPHHGPPMKGDKPKHFKQAILKLFKYCKEYVPIILIASILAVIGVIFTVYGPELLSQMTDTIQQGIVSVINLEQIQTLGFYLILLYGLSFLFGYTQGFIMATVTQKITRKMRSDLARKMNQLPLNYFDQTTVGNTLSRVTNDVDTIGQTLNQSLGQLITAGATFIGVLIMMFYTNWIMALTAIGATIIGFIFMSIIMGISQKYFIGQQAQLANLNGHIEEMYSGHQVVKAYNGEMMAKAQFHTINDNLYTNAWKAQFLSGLMMPVMMFIGNFGYVMVCIVGAVLVVNGQITIGVIVAFMVYIRLFTQPLTQLAQAATSLQSTAAASERVFEFLEEPLDESQEHVVVQPTQVKGEVIFDHVSFGYHANQMIIRDFTLHVKAGQKIAIVGPTGAGKTTLVNLLMRFYEVNSGDIFIDGISIQALSKEAVHDLFCMVLQDTWLFEGTIYDNIAYVKENVGIEAVMEAAKAVGIHRTIQALPNGYETILTDQVNLSVGQKQLITIARAMMNDAPLLILDEATSSVDTRTEVQIQQAMDKLSQGKTSFVIAHRLSTIRNADVIIVMKDGDILETGSHEQLIAQQGFYEKLYNSQFEEATHD